LFTATDADQHDVLTYTLQQLTTDPNSGHFEVNGAQQAPTQIQPNPRIGAASCSYKIAARGTTDASGRPVKKHTVRTTIAERKSAAKAAARDIGD
jgi:hypothetical protein